MIKIIILIIACHICTGLMAQETRYFIDNRETVPQSVYLLNPAHIDSIRMLTKDQALSRLGPKINPGDSAVVIVMKTGSELVSFDELLKSFYIEPDAAGFTIYGPGFIDLKHPELLLASADMVYSISVQYIPNLRYTLSISTYYTTFAKVKSPVLAPLKAIRKEYNNVNPYR